MVREMPDSKPMQCPKCGGRQEKDLRRMRRTTGWGLVVLGLLALTALAMVQWRAPRWSLVVCVVVVLFGVLALRGAGAARYCADCDVRLEPAD
jgi:hypothetical protein